MTKLLTEVMRKIIELPEQRQDDAARVLMRLLESDARPYQLSEEQLQEVDAAMAEADRGDFAAEGQVRDALSRRWA